MHFQQRREFENSDWRRSANLVPARLEDPVPRTCLGPLRLLRFWHKELELAFCQSVGP